jgi:hypothetical protein
MEKLLLSTAYFPDIQYFRAIYNNTEIFLEQFENFPKQSFRNRAYIMTDHGKMSLNIPLEKVNSKHLTKDVRISQRENWQSKHWHAIVSAYNSSPFFEYFRDEIEEFFAGKYEFLLDFNTQILYKILNMLDIKREIKLTEDYVFEDASNGFEDLRGKIHPKKAQIEGVNYYDSKPYPQVFDSKFPFEPNLSIIDLIFNTGEEAVNYLKQ